jgi:hypothetical protein
VQSSEYESNAAFRRRPPGSPGSVPGTISWAEHEQAWIGYAARNPGQSAERLAARGGFGWFELVMFLGHEPKTWRPGQEVLRRG